MAMNEVLDNEEARLAKRRAYSKLLRNKQNVDLMREIQASGPDPAIFSGDPMRRAGNRVIPFTPGEMLGGVGDVLGKMFLGYKANQAGQDVADSRSAYLAEQFGGGQQVTPEALMQSPDPEMQKAGLQLAMHRAQGRYAVPHVSSTQQYNLPTGEVGLANVLSTGEWQPIDGVTRPRELQSIDTGTSIYRVPKVGPQDPQAEFAKQLPPQAPTFHAETGTLFNPNLRPGVAGAVQTIAKPGYQAKSEQESRQKVIDEVEKSFQAQSAVMNAIDSAVLPLIYAEAGGEPLYNNKGNLIAPEVPGVLTSNPKDRARKLLHDTIGVPDKRAERTKALEAAAAKLTLSVGSLGNQVSDKDRETYEKAFGQFQKAQTVQDMVEALNMMRRTYSGVVKAREQVQSQRESGETLNPRVEPAGTAQAIKEWYRQDPENRRDEAYRRLKSMGLR